MYTHVKIVMTKWTDLYVVASLTLTALAEEWFNIIIVL